MPETAAPRILISYSHDDPAHCDRVLALADRLRADGIDAVVDQYNFDLSNPQGKVNHDGSVLYHGPMIELQFLF